MSHCDRGCCGGGRHVVCNIEQHSGSRPVLRSGMSPFAAPSASGYVSGPERKANRDRSGFDVKSFLDSSGLGKRVIKLRGKQAILTQGEPAKNVAYIQEGSVTLTVVSKAGKEAIVGILGPGEFFGVGCLAGQTKCTASARTIGPTTLLIIEKSEMIRVLHREHQFSDRFIACLLARNIRVEADLVDQLFNSSEKRLARALLLLAQYGEPNRPPRTIPKVSQETLAEMIGTTRSRVNCFMNKFRKLGFIQYDGEIHVNDSLLTVVLHD